MPNPRMLSGLMALLLSASVAAIVPITASAQEQQPPSKSAPSTDKPPVTRRGRMDPYHPLHIGINYYPRESLLRR
jgi:hypothetical protein